MIHTIDPLHDGESPLTPPAAVSLFTIPRGPISGTILAIPFTRPSVCFPFVPPSALAYEGVDVVWMAGPGDGGGGGGGGLGSEMVMEW